MSTLFLKSLLSSGIASIALLSSGHSALAQSTDFSQAKQLADIAFGYAIANQPNKAIPLLEQAATYAGGDCFESNAWLKIGVGYRAVNQSSKAETFLTRAVETAIDHTEGKCASSGTSPSESMLNRTVEYAEAGHLELAVHLVQQVQAWSHPLAMAEIAAEYERAGQPRQAQQMIAQAVAEMKKYENEDLVDVVTANQLFLAATGLLILEEQKDLAKLVIEKSEILSFLEDKGTDVLEDDFETYQVLGLARLLIEIDKTQQALAVLDATRPTIQPSPRFPLDEAHSWIDLAQLYSKLGSDQAESTWEKARTIVEQMPNASTKSSAQRALVQAYSESEDFERALALAETIENVSARQRAYGAIAVAYAKAGLVEDANSLVESIGTPDFAKREVIRTYLETEQYAEAERLAKQSDRLDFLPQVGSAYCRMELPERVVPLFEYLSETNSHPVTWLRQCTATAFARQGQFDQAMEVAQTVTGPETKAAVLVAIAAQHTNPSNHSAWGRFVQRLPYPLRAWLSPAETQEAVDILDQALALIQTDS
ncbi:hypothetical protein QGP82_00685 [Leptothoe sp. LEGE 181152]|nr:hypothetical protein [Leptothoe sp. LEGE 181152]